MPLNMERIRLPFLISKMIDNNTLPTPTVTSSPHPKLPGLILFTVFLVIGLTAFGLGFWSGRHLHSKVLGEEIIEKDGSFAQTHPLQKYTIQNLQSYPYQISEISVDKVLGTFPEYTSYLFSYKTMGRKMTGQLNVPNSGENFPVIVMVRGFVEQETYTTGEGTRPGAAAFAKAGFVTFAPDFFGFGGSDSEAPGWEARFQKPINVVELIQSIRHHQQLTYKNKMITLNPEKLGLWGHSNGGQITLTSLEAMAEPIPTVLWAPVTAPFPYSILYFSDEDPDEGKRMRSSVAELERDYDSQDFSLTQHLNRLVAPIQLHQGTADDAVPKTWSDEFVQKIQKENQRRQEEINNLKANIASQSAEKAATDSAAVTPQNIVTSAEIESVLLEPVNIDYFVYPGANHSLRPSWDTVVERNIQFFKKHLQ
jgi:dienelactone hydrolase